MAGKPENSPIIPHQFAGAPMIVAAVSFLSLRATSSGSFAMNVACS